MDEQDYTEWFDAVSQDEPPEESVDPEPPDSYCSFKRMMDLIALGHPLYKDLKTNAFWFNIDGIIIYPQLGSQAGLKSWE